MAKVEAAKLRQKFLNEQVRFYRQLLDQADKSTIHTELWSVTETSLYNIWNEHVSREFANVIPWNLTTKSDPDGTKYLYSDDWGKSFSRCVDLTERGGAVGGAIEQVESFLNYGDLSEGSIVTFSSPKGPTDIPNSEPYTVTQTYIFILGPEGRHKCFTVVTDSSLEATEKFMDIRNPDSSVWERTKQATAKVKIIKPIDFSDNPLERFIEQVKSSQEPNSKTTNSDFEHIKDLLLNPQEVEAAWKRMQKVQSRMQALKEQFLNCPNDNKALLTTLALNFTELFDLMVAQEYKIPTERSGGVILDSGCITIGSESGNLFSPDNPNRIVCPDCGWKPSEAQKLLMRHGLLTKCPNTQCEYDPCTKSGKLRRVHLSD